MQARDIMTTRVISVGEDTPVQDVVRRLIEHGISAVPVVDARGVVVGMLSEGDLLASPEAALRRQVWWLSALMVGGTVDFERIHGSTAADVMSSPVVSVSGDTSLAEIARLLERKHIKRVPVLDAGRLVGIVSRANLLHALANDIIEQHQPGAGEDRALRQRVVAALGKEPLLSALLVNATVNDGVVSLWGVVENDAQREAAERAAQGIDGVRSVDNHLGPAPVSGLPL